MAKLLVFLFLLMGAALVVIERWPLLALIVFAVAALASLEAARRLDSSRHVR